MLYALAPKAVDQVLHLAYKVFPDGPAEEAPRLSGEQLAMAHLLKGGHF